VALDRDLDRNRKLEGGNLELLSQPSARGLESLVIPVMLVPLDFWKFAFQY
jgi:hypothetical protein